MDERLKRYRGLDSVSKTLLQAIAMQHDRMDHRSLWQLGRRLGLRSDNNRQLTQSSVRERLTELSQGGLVSRPDYRPTVQIHDFLVREALSSAHAETFARTAESIRRWGPQFERLEFYVAFYQQDASTFRDRASKIAAGSLPLLSPFCEETFDALTPEFQRYYFAFVVPGWIARGDADAKAVQRLKGLVGSQDMPAEFQPTAVQWAVAAGDLECLRWMASAWRNCPSDVAGCLELLEGNFEASFDLLAASLSSSKTKQSLTRLGELPSMYALLTSFHGGTNLTADKALQAAGAAQRGAASPYPTAFAMIEHALRYSITPANPGGLRATLSVLAKKPLDKLIAGYLQTWLNLDEDGKSEVSGLVPAAAQFDSGDCQWLAAEAYAIAGRGSLQTAAKQSDQAKQLHKKLGTASLIDLVKPRAAWARTLDAISRLGAKSAPATTARSSDEATNRLIYELTHNARDFQLDVYQQIRKGKTWSKGRKVALARLHHQYQEPAFAFLMPEDHALCRTLRHWTEQGPYGYPEEHCEFETRSAARALIGHPRIYAPGERVQPLEITETPVRLMVRDVGNDSIEVTLHPTPAGENDLRIEITGPNGRAITLFDPAHLELGRMLDRGLTVPASAADQVMQAVTQVASLVTVHSEVNEAPQLASGKGGRRKSTDDAAIDSDANIQRSRRVDGDARVHLHLRPSGDGFYVDIRIHPLGESGPACAPGDGGTTLLATIDGGAISADRDFETELKHARSVLEQAPTLAEFLIEDWAACLSTLTETLRFVEEIEPLVAAEQVMVHWPKGKSLQLAGRATERMLRVSIRRDRDWFAATGKLKVDRNLTLDMMELIDLVAESPSRFIRLDDGRFLSLAENLRARIRDLHSFGDGRGVKNKLRFAAVHAGLLGDLGEVKVTADAHWKKCVARMEDADKIELRIPQTLQAELRDYQREGVYWMMRLATWGVGGCLADDMGLGKTVQAIALLLSRGRIGPAMIVAPTSVIHNWRDELVRFAPTLRWHVLGEADQRDKLLKSLSSGDVLLCSYGLLTTEAKSLAKVDFATLILDEAQAIKNPTTQRSEAAKSISADCRFILTGTPMENHLGELWNLMDFINPGLLGSEESFRQRFAIPIECDGDRGTAARLKRLVTPFLLRRTKAQVLTELPPRTEVTLRIDPSDEEAAFYESVRQRAIQTIEQNTDDKPTHLRVLGEIMRLRRACCHPRLVIPEADIAASKLTRLLELIDGLREGNHRALVFSQFVDHLSIVREELDARKISYQYLDGSTPAAARKKRVQAFQAGEGDVFLISLKAGGTGLNLTGADYVIHLDPWWNPAVEDQASDRAHRIGQQRPVTIYRMILSGTIEERILELHESKRDLADSLLEGTDRSGKLSTEDLLRLVRP